MSRATGLILIFIGAMMIYLAIFGISGFAMFQWTGNTYTDSFDYLNQAFWDLITPSEPAGTAKFQGTYRVDWPSSIPKNEWFFLRSKQSFDFSKGGSISLEILGGECASINIHIGIYRQNAYVLYRNKQVGWQGVHRYINGELKRLKDEILGSNFQYEGKVKIEVTPDHTVNFYIDGRLICSDTFSLPSFENQVGIGMLSTRERSGYGEVDNFVLELASGAPPPSDGQPPGGDYGTIKFYASYNGQYVTATLNIRFPDGSTITAQTPYENTQAPTGYYSVTCTYLGNTLTHTFTLTKGGTEIHTFNFGGEEPPPPPSEGGNILDKIEAMLQDPTVRSLMTFIGVSCLGIGFIMVIAGGPRSPPPIRY